MYIKDKTGLVFQTGLLIHTNRFKLNSGRGRLFQLSGRYLVLFFGLVFQAGRGAKPCISDQPLFFPGVAPTRNQEEGIYFCSWIDYASI